MKILFCAPDAKPEPWVDLLRSYLPAATIEAWTPGMAFKADYAVVWSAPQRFIDEQPQLQVLFNLGAGVDALRVLRLAPQTRVVRVEDAGMGAQMAEFVSHAVIRHFRELDAFESDTRAGVWKLRRPQSRADFPVGIMGLGVLGARVAVALQAFDFSVKGWSRTTKSLAGVQCFTGMNELPQFLSATRVLVCLLPLTDETEGIINRATLAQLQPKAYVVNVARGAHVVDADLLAMMASGHVAGAALDVFRTEPLSTDHPFWQEPRITLTPHISARTLREQTLAQIATKMQSLAHGRAVAGIVDFKRGY